MATHEELDGAIGVIGRLGLSLRSTEARLAHSDAELAAAKKRIAELEARVPGATLANMVLDAADGDSEAAAT